MKKSTILNTIIMLYYGLANGQHVSVNCPEGASWQAQKKAVVILENGCSGSLLNGGNGKVYVLTAKHCYQNSAHVPFGGTINSTVRFNYENTSCASTSISANDVVVSCVLKAVSLMSPHPTSPGSDADYILFEVMNPSVLPSDKEINLAGWEKAANTSITSGVGIHHPAFSSKKISTYSAGPVWNVGYKFNIYAVRTISGFQGTTGGSSGSPLFNQNGRVVGVLNGGGGNWQTDVPIEGYLSKIVYGSFNYAWSNSVDAHPLSKVFDTLNKGFTYMNGTSIYEMRRITSGSKYIVSKNSNYNIGNDGITGGSIVQRSKDTDPGYGAYMCTGCTPMPSETMRSFNRWFLSVDQYGYYKFILSGFGGYIFDIAGASTSAGAELVTYLNKSYPGDFNQRFRLIPTLDGDNSYYIQNVNSGLFLDVSGGDTAKGAKVIQWTFNGSNNQKWYIKDNGSTSSFKMTEGTIASIDEEAWDKKNEPVQLYPIPASDWLTITSSSSDRIMVGSIYDLQGRKVQDFHPTGALTKLDLSGFAPGFYVLKLALSNGQFEVHKFEKQ